MSRNLGRKSHHIERCNTHVKLINEIADVKSLLDNSTQQTKELKARLNELAEKKKDAGKSPRNIQAPSNRFNTPIPKIQGLFIDSSTSKSSPAAAAVNSASASTVILADQSSESRVELEDQAMFEHNHSPDTVHHLFQPQAVAPTLPVLGSVHHLHFDSEREFGDNPGVETPSFDFDLDLFSEMLDQEPIPVPTGAELAAHAFLRTVLGK
jgi:hypothetical protein